MPANEIYVSTDVETDGPIPGSFSLLSLGSVAYDENGAEIGRFAANLKPLPNAATSPQTMAWWTEHQAQWDLIQVNQEDAATAMQRYCAWLEALPGAPVFLAYPASFDFMFVYWYLMELVGRSPFGHAALDIKSYAMGRLDGKFTEQTRSKKLADFSQEPLTHDALDDALNQAEMFFRIKQNKRR